jgi:hypothetical protein
MHGSGEDGGVNLGKENGKGKNKKSKGFDHI